MKVNIALRCLTNADKIASWRNARRWGDSRRAWPHQGAIECARRVRQMARQQDKTASDGAP